jgi:beta-galactosidase
VTSTSNSMLVRARNLSALFVIFGISLSAANSQVTTPNSQTVQLGAAWYPEQWPESRWESDLTLMEQAHLTVARVGEFAWATLEPAEGRFDLDWLERAIRLAEKHHIAIVLGTPTDAPPAWLTSKYPSTRGMNADGRLREHGNRRQFSYSSPLYRRMCVDLATRLAKRFGRDPNVIGWQIGNEIADESFDPATRAQFQAFLRAKYKTLDNLNAHWTTEYWSQAYTAWSQIPLNGENGNPALMLEHRHFVTATWQSFLHDQIAAIRALADKGQFVTTNVGGLGWTDNWDHYKINQELDLASWDDYVGTGHLNVLRNAFMNDFVRGWKRKNFWVMETEPGTVNWSPLNNSLDPGETRALAWQTIGHGADAVLYWQWRSALNGQEQYHGALVGPDGTPLPIYDEVQQFGSDLLKTSAALRDTTPTADVALLIDYDSRWAIEFQPFNKNYDVLQVALDYYQALSAGGRTVDAVSPDAPLSQYKLVVAPSLNVLPQSLADHLLDYVRSGGQLVLGPRSGMKDEFDALDPHRQPGPLADALGGRVDQYYALESPIAVGNASSRGTASIWAERLNAISADTHILLRYGSDDGWLKDRPAALSRNIGGGSLTYIGALLDQKLLATTLAPMLQHASAPSAIFAAPLPPDIELCRRENPANAVFIVINHSRTSTIHLKLAAPARNLLDSNKTINTLDLQPQAVAVLQAPQ